MSESASPRRWLELVPAVLIASLWAKLVLASVTLPTPWAPEDRYVGGATLAVLLMLGAPLPALPRWWRYLAAVFLNLLLSALILADLVHFRVFSELLSLPDLSRAAQLPIGFQAAMSALERRDLLLLVDGVLALLASSAYRRLCRAHTGELSWRAAAGWSALILASGVGVGAPILRAISVDREEVYDYAYSRQFIARGIGLLPYHVHDAYIQLAFAALGRFGTSSAERNRVRDYMRAFRADEAPPSEMNGIAAGKNLIIVMAESLQAFPIGLSINGQLVTPNLNNLAQESLHFVNFFDQTHLGTTSDGEFTSLQSLHPLTAGAVATRYPTNTLRALPAMLAEHGYTTFSAVGEPGNEWNMLQMHPKLGFQHSFFKDAFTFDFEFGPGVPDHIALPQAAKMMRAQPRPFMAFVLSLSNHAPYDLPLALRQLSVGTLESTLLGQYLQSVHYFDHALGAMLAELKANGLLDESVIAIYGDHHGFLDDPPALAALLQIDASDQRGRWKVQKRLPFLIRLPHAEHAQEYTSAAGHLDVAPTLLGLLGIDAPTSVGLGHDLMRGQSHMVVFRDGSFIDDEHELMRVPGPADASPCYDAHTGRPVPAHTVAAKRRAADERLAISDLIIHANLIPMIAADRGENHESN